MSLHVKAVTNLSNFKKNLKNEEKETEEEDNYDSDSSLDSIKNEHLTKANSLITSEQILDEQRLGNEKQLSAVSVNQDLGITGDTGNQSDSVIKATAANPNSELVTDEDETPIQVNSGSEHMSKAEEEEGDNTGTKPGILIKLIQNEHYQNKYETLLKKLNLYTYNGGTVQLSNYNFDFDDIKHSMEYFYNRMTSKKRAQLLQKYPKIQLFANLLAEENLKKFIYFSKIVPTIRWWKFT